MCTRRLARLVALTVAMLAPIASHADTVASLLGNFTINQFSALTLAESRVGLHYAVVFGQLPALRELHEADADHNGVTSQAERDAYVARLAPGFAERFHVAADGVSIPLRAKRWTTSLPTEQGGFSLRVDVDLEGDLPPAMAHGIHRLEFANGNYPGRFGWQEIVVERSAAFHIFATDAFGTSLTDALTQALRDLPPTGPLAERAVHLSFTTGPIPAGQSLLAPRPGTTWPTGAVTPRPAADGGNWLARETRRVVGLISGPIVAPHIALLALLASFVLGALHAFSPGHGKAVVGAYLIGSQATPRHAVFLGAVVTITHTLGVFALGLATLLASKFFLPERIFPVLGFVSGLLVVVMGLALLIQRSRIVRTELRVARVTRRGAVATRFRSVAVPSSPGSLLFANAHGDHHDFGHVHGGTAHSHGAFTHSHGGSTHTHLPPGTDGERVTWRSLLALGISGGLVPCPSAMVLLLAAIGLNKTAYGLVLVVAFSLGLAATLTAVGFAFLYARRRLARVRKAPRWSLLLPAASAAAITLIGVALCYSAAVSAL